MDEGELRGWMAAHLRRDKVPGPVWDILQGRGHVEDILEGRITRERILVYAKALLGYSDIAEQIESPWEPDGRPPIEPPSFSDYEKERPQTLAEYLKLKGTAYPGVLEFRRSCWGEVLPLVPENAYRLVEEKELQEVVTGGHLYSDVDDIEPSGYVEFFSRTPGQVQLVGFYKGSYFERLHDLSKELIEKLFPRWSEAEATWFVLTGEVTVPKALSGEIDSFVGDYLTYGTVTLTVEPWMAIETIVKAYQYLQAQVLRRKPRALSQRNLAVVQFVIRELKEMVIGVSDEQSEQANYPEEEFRDRVKDPDPEMTYQDEWADPERRPWRTLMERWNQANPDSTYQDERQFHRDFYRTAWAVVRPYADAPAGGISIP